MNSNLAALTTWSYGFAGLGYLLLGIYLFGQEREEVRRQSRQPAVAMLLGVAFSVCWAALTLASGLMGSAGTYSVAVVFDVLRYGAWYAFVFALLRPTERSPAFRWVFVTAVTIIVLGVAGQLALIAGIAPPLLAAKGVLFHFLLMIVVALFLLEQVFRNVAADSLWNIKPICLGLGGAFLFDLYLYSDALLFGRLDADAVGIRGFVHALVIPLIALSVARSRDWTRKVRLSQRVVMHSTVLVAAGGYLLFMSGVGYYVRYFGGEWGRALNLALVFATLLALSLLALSGSMRAKVRVLVGKHFFRYRYDYREEWLKVTRTLSAQHTPQAMGEQVIRALADLVESPSGCLWLWDASRQVYRQFARWNMPEIDALLDRNSSLCAFMLKSGWVINLEEFRSLPSRYEALELPDWLSDLQNAWLIVPLMTGDDMTGFVVLGSSRTQLEVNWEVNDLLRTASSQAAGFLAQTLATEALLEARKFDAFNRMSAFVVHDLKNIVSQLSLMLKNAQRHKDNPEFQQDMLMTVEHAVDRMKQLMLQLREGAAPTSAVCGVDLAALFGRVQTAKQTAGCVVDVETLKSVSVRGDQERLERVFGHLVQNSLDAIDEGGRVWVRLDQEGGSAKVEVADNGRGMTKEFIRERLFKPFQTTKHAGMGIGAYESFQYIRELGGEITVESELNVGTRICVLLPLFQAARGSDLIQREAA
jgi:putative PEP-CTERM system histidine kinase